jgi:predicted small secreted protein
MTTTITLRRTLLAAMLVATAALGACNTTEGVGKDVESAGDAVQDAAKDVKKKM